MTFMEAVRLLIATTDPYHLLMVGYTLGGVCMFAALWAARRYAPLIVCRLGMHDDAWHEDVPGWVCQGCGREGGRRG